MELCTHLVITGAPYYGIMYKLSYYRCALSWNYVQTQLLQVGIIMELCTNLVITGAPYYGIMYKHSYYRCALLWNYVQTQLLQLGLIMELCENMWYGFSCAWKLNDVVLSFLCTLLRLNWTNLECYNIE